MLNWLNDINSMLNTLRSPFLSTEEELAQVTFVTNHGVNTSTVADLRNLACLLASQLEQVDSDNGNSQPIKTDIVNLYGWTANATRLWGEQ